MTSNDHENAQLGQAFRALADGARPSPDCPDPEQIWDARAGHLPLAHVRKVVDHISTCPSCAEAWRLAHQLGHGVGQEPASVAHPAPRGKPWQWAAAAAALIAVGLIFAHLWRTDTGVQAPAGYRAPDSESIRSLLVDGVAVPREHCLLRWSAESDKVSRYDVRVATEDLQVLALARGLEEPEYLVPKKALEQIPEGELILWQVEALLDDGSSSISPTFVNQLE